MSKITKASKGCSCIRCGAEEAYSCHYNGVRQHDFGKGRGIKCNDLMTAELCHTCDQRFSEGSTDSMWKDKWDRSEEFMYLVCMTNIRRLDNGILKV